MVTADFELVQVRSWNVRDTPTDVEKLIWDEKMPVCFGSELQHYGIKLTSRSVNILATDGTKHILKQQPPLLM